jgi:hypothetical protein
MTGDEFARALLDSAKRDIPAAGARERAIAALGSATGGLMLLKLVGVLLLVGAGGVGLWAAGNRTSTPVKESAPPAQAAHVPLPTAMTANWPQAEPGLLPHAKTKTPTLTAAKACSTWGRPVRQIVENRLNVPVDLYWINYECEEQLAASGHIAAGATYEAWSFDTHPFRVRDAATQQVIKDIAPMSPEPETARVFIDGQQAPMDGPPTACSTKPNRDANYLIVNATKAPIEAFWVDYQCKEISYGRIDPGDEREQATFYTHPWRFRDAQTHKLLYELAALPTDQWKEWRTVLAP